jgi:hypothetical protein
MGCSSFSQIDAGDVGDHGKTRLTLKDGSRFVVAHPQVKADTLAGFRAESWNERQNAYADTVRVPFDQIETLEGSHFSAGKTLGLVAGIVGVVFIVGAIAWSQADLFEGNPLGNFN